MDHNKVTRISLDIHNKKQNGKLKVFKPEFPNFLVQIPQKLQNCLKMHLKKNVKSEEEADFLSSGVQKDPGSYAALNINLEKQLQAWKENPTWVDQPPHLKVSVPKGSLCNLDVKFNVGLPPDAIYNIVIDPDNKRVFKNIKEVISRRVLVDEGLRQVVEVEQAALWKFLWWSGTISVHVIVDQNRKDHSVKFKQGKTGFMKRFEGCWTLQPLLVDEKSCFPFKPKTLAEYNSCTGGKGRVGSIVSLEQLVQPSLVPPPPISWYLRGITARTTEMLITDLQEEAARIRGDPDKAKCSQQVDFSPAATDLHTVDALRDVKERWAWRRRHAKRHKSCLRSPSTL
ncbi:PREDICTED: uncharacterized protein LOC104593182 [Nelumbo nucifera]|uniref:Uncharacterized protein LOC104593182 n=1 Tax=Nelumbo nucifera TaxID=4432 RepID=A0A1U7ZSK8_NELNU|nr:PREDICTED: uncharacterized protein LOC104593182 [Nelumbo nucifera]XP_010251234.1 PREDICTED: uncharacterized protein LOC104593182 [Nelumbo nucifera]